jgi:C1A family cysteine protease
MLTKLLSLSLILLLFNSCNSEKTTKYPSVYELHTVEAVSSFKEQAWGCCWSFSVMSSLESNLMKSKTWQESGESGEPDLSEYHMDKFNGFNRDGRKGDRQSGWYSGQGSSFKGSNTDDLSSGVVVHLGGDFRMATAYLSNHGGAVQERLSNTKIDNKSFKSFGNTPMDGVLYENGYTYYLPRHIEWLTLTGSEFEKRDRVKGAIMKYGAVASAQHMNNTPLSKWKDGREIHINTKSSRLNHAVSIIGWNDDVEFEYHKGAWLVKDSDHKDEKTGKHIGEFYIMYDDIHVSKDPFMGGVSFRDIAFYKTRPNSYFHSLHGWRYETLANIEEVKVNFIANGNERIKDVGVYSTEENVSIEFDIFVNGKKVYSKSELFKLPGFHMISLDSNIDLKKGDNLSIRQRNSNKSYAYDASFLMEVLLSGKLPKWGDPVSVNSKSSANETFYKTEDSNVFKDFMNYTNTRDSKGVYKHAKSNNTSSIALNLYTVNL